MLSFDAFAARVRPHACDDGGGGDDDDATEKSGGHHHPMPHLRPLPPSSSSAPPPPPLLATLDDAYDVYVNAHGTGLWFDANPLWEPNVGCYYLRLEPEKAPTRTRRVKDRELERRRRSTMGSTSVDAPVKHQREPEPAEFETLPPRPRTVLVPVSARRASP